MFLSLTIIIIFITYFFGNKFYWKLQQKRQEEKLEKLCKGFYTIYNDIFRNVSFLYAINIFENINNKGETIDKKLIIH